MARASTGAAANTAHTADDSEGGQKQNRGLIGAYMGTDSARTAAGDSCRHSKGTGLAAVRIAFNSDSGTVLQQHAQWIVARSTQRRRTVAGSIHSNSG